MVLQNKHKQLASKQYKKSHGIPLSTSNTSTSTESRPRETGQERALRLGSNADRYTESDDDEPDDPQGDQVDEELIAHQKAEAEALELFLAKQQAKLAESSTRSHPSTDDDDDDVDSSFAHLRISNRSKKGKVVMGSQDEQGFKGLEGEAKRAQAIRALKDRFSIPSPPPPPSTSSSSNSTSATTTKSRNATVNPSRSTEVRKPPPLPGMNKGTEGAGGRGGQEFLDSLL